MFELRNKAWPENDSVLRELLDLRAEHALLLGYDGWPDYDAEVKMIGAGAEIAEFIDRIADVADAPAHRDLDVLLERVRHDQPDASGVSTADHSLLQRAGAVASSSTSTPRRCAPTSTSTRCAPGCSTSPVSCSGSRTRGTGCTAVAFRRAGVRRRRRR